MRTVAIVGTGLIGASVGLALRKQGVTTYLIDEDPAAARAAEALGAGLAQPVREPADLAVIAVPPTRVAAALAEHQRLGTARFYTDVSGVKVRLHREIEDLGCDLPAVVGGHPMVGGGWAGPWEARADLFEGRRWVLTPNELTDNLALNHALELVALCGAVSVLLDPETHDRVLALVSHAPHLIASLAAARLLDVDEAAIRLAGQDLRDITRGTGGNPETWTDILTANAGPVADQLDVWAAEVQLLAQELRAVDRSTDGLRPVRIPELLRFGAAGRARIPEDLGVREEGNAPEGPLVRTAGGT
ncbi:MULTISPECIES: prephenate dehydrogenase [unclassified Streptomyces]|uniref:prephenate dehydrogenase n=1 Tax=unclassified Streptomyces TaxID=2593676 RepID=UPI002481E023|nr:MULTISPECIES: prephenate dehydrogenase [unclassified Streptomyces]MDA5284139.1 prephenate dehydrogenase [Streptomyces sp. Isolate_45]MDX2394505.1 prephenate dehydrogenase [Streptomyces sp. DK15]